MWRRPARPPDGGDPEDDESDLSPAADFPIGPPTVLPHFGQK